MPGVPTRLWITLNARLRPLDRGDRYEDPLQAVLDVQAPGSQITGGGTQLTALREPAFSDIDMDVEGDPDSVRSLVIAALESFGAPKGSRAKTPEGDPVTFGVTEGLAIYLNGTDLPDEVYEDSDVNELIETLLRSLDGEGDMQSYWEGPAETALYLYGPSAERMRELSAEVLRQHPLAQQCRVVALDLTLPSLG